MAPTIQDLSISGGVEINSFPAKSKQVSGLVHGTPTDVTSTYFADKILITISQAGRLSQWVCALECLQVNSLNRYQIQVALNSASPTNFDTALPSSGDLLPLEHLTPKTLLGAGGEKRETIGQLYAAQIASRIATRDPEEMRTVVIGFGLQNVEQEREAFFDMLELVQQVI